MYAVGVPVLCVLRGLPARKEQQKEKARTSFSKQGREAEGEQRQGQTQQGNLLTDAAYFAWRIAQSKPDRERKADRVVEAQHEVRRRAKQSTTSSKHSTTPKQSTKSEAKHGVRGKARRLSCLLQAREKLFPYFVPPFRRSRRRRWAPAMGLQCVRQPGDCGRLWP